MILLLLSNACLSVLRNHETRDELQLVLFTMGLNTELWREQTTCPLLLPANPHPTAAGV